MVVVPLSSDPVPPSARIALLGSVANSSNQPTSSSSIHSSLASVNQSMRKRSVTNWGRDDGGFQTLSTSIGSGTISNPPRSDDTANGEPPVKRIHALPQM